MPKELPIGFDIRVFEEDRNPKRSPGLIALLQDDKPQEPVVDMPKGPALKSATATEDGPKRLNGMTREEAEEFIREAKNDVRKLLEIAPEDQKDDLLSQIHPNLEFLCIEYLETCWAPDDHNNLARLAALWEDDKPEDPVVDTPKEPALKFSTAPNGGPKRLDGMTLAEAEEFICTTKKTMMDLIAVTPENQMDDLLLQVYPTLDALYIEYHEKCNAPAKTIPSLKVWKKNKRNADLIEFLALISQARSIEKILENGPESLRCLIEPDEPTDALNVRHLLHMLNLPKSDLEYLEGLLTRKPPPNQMWDDLQKTNQLIPGTENRRNLGNPVYFIRRYAKEKLYC